ncbi:MAG: cytidylate kinase-like family protein [Desulfobulbaceae bacterium]|nr:cytidylate kinase-like family protein [Desulfobulbaceae bacterium]
MSIITINRGSYSRGKEVAEKLALKLGYECISRDILLEASQEFNIPEIKLIRALHDPTSVLERFTYGKERYISYLYAALLQHVRKDNIVYHGLAGQYFLRDISHVLKVRIIADMQARVSEEMRRENISEEKALYILQKDDEERRKWGLQVYGTDTWDSRPYDIVLHIGRLTVDDAVDILFDTVKKPNFQATEESRKLVNDLALSAKVKANLAKIAPKIQVLADHGSIHIRNMDKTPGSSDEAQMKRIAMQIEGVEEVIFSVSASREQHDYINPFHNIG